MTRFAGQLLSPLLPRVPKERGDKTGLIFSCSLPSSLAFKPNQIISSKQLNRRSSELEQNFKDELVQAPTQSFSLWNLFLYLSDWRYLLEETPLKRPLGETSVHQGCLSCKTEVSPTSPYLPSLVVPVPMSELNQNKSTSLSHLTAPSHFQGHFKATQMSFNLSFLCWPLWVLQLFIPAQQPPNLISPLQLSGSSPLDTAILETPDAVGVI